MRELKFRAWLVPYNQSDGKPSKREKPYYDYFDLEDEYGDDTWFDGADVQCFEQYTGLEDKNGKEIYEGDIILVANHGRTPYVVIHREWDCSFVCNNENLVDFVHMFKTMPQCYEVIGNIHENPELLEQGNAKD